MDAERFDRFARSLSPGASRRGLFAGLTQGLLASLLLAQRGEQAAAKNKRKKRKKKKRKKKNATNSCTPNCMGKTCGDDGCGSSCGACTGGSCSGGTCICPVSQEFCSGSCLAPCAADFARDPVFCTCCRRNHVTGCTGVKGDCCSGICDGGACFGLQFGMACRFDAQCDDLLFCRNGTCA